MGSRVWYGLAGVFLDIPLMEDSVFNGNFTYPG